MTLVRAPVSTNVILSARMKTVTIILTLCFGSIFSAQCANNRDSSVRAKNTISVPGIWRYNGGDEQPMEIHFLADRKVMFNGGYKFYNPAQWSFTPTTRELKLTVPKMKEADFKLFNQWKYTGLKVDPKKKSIVYTLSEPRICFMGYFFEKEQQ